MPKKGRLVNTILVLVLSIILILVSCYVVYDKTMESRKENGTHETVKEKSTVFTEQEVKNIFEDDLVPYITNKYSNIENNTFNSDKAKIGYMLLSHSLYVLRITNFCGSSLEKELKELNVIQETYENGPICRNVGIYKVADLKEMTKYIFGNDVSIDFKSILNSEPQIGKIEYFYEKNNIIVYLGEVNSDINYSFKDYYLDSETLIINFYVNDILYSATFSVDGNYYLINSIKRS